MATKARLSIIACTVILVGTLSSFRTYQFPTSLRYHEEIVPVVHTTQGTQFKASDFEDLVLRKGVTIHGDSYSVDHPAAWNAYLSTRALQNTAMQGASIDDTYAHAATMSASDRAALPNDLVRQAQQLRYLTDTVVIWFGINDLMTFHTWARDDRHLAIAAEINTLFSYIDAILASGVEKVVVPNVLDFAQSPGLYIARKTNTTVSLRTTTEAIYDWNTRIAAEIATREKVKTIDFYAISREWMQSPEKFGLSSLLRVGEEKDYLWKDFLHMTDWTHEHLIAPLFEQALFT